MSKIEFDVLLTLIAFSLLCVATGKRLFADGNEHRFNLVMPALYGLAIIWTLAILFEYASAVVLGTNASPVSRSSILLLLLLPLLRTIDKRTVIITSIFATTVYFLSNVFIPPIQPWDDYTHWLPIFRNFLNYGFSSGLVEGVAQPHYPRGLAVIYGVLGLRGDYFFAKAAFYLNSGLFLLGSWEIARGLFFKVEGVARLAAGVVTAVVILKLITTPLLFSFYADFPIGVLFGLTVLFCTRVNDFTPRPIEYGVLLFLLGFIIANVKNYGLYLLVVPFISSVIILIIFGRSCSSIRILTNSVYALLGGVLGHGLWASFLTHLHPKAVRGEFLPISDWNFKELPDIVTGMVVTYSSSRLFSVIVTLTLVTCLSYWWGLRDRALTRIAIPCGHFLLTFFGVNLVIFGFYLVSMSPDEAARVASLLRYAFPAWLLLIPLSVVPVIRWVTVRVGRAKTLTLVLFFTGAVIVREFNSLELSRSAAEATLFRINSIDQEVRTLINKGARKNVVLISGHQGNESLPKLFFNLSPVAKVSWKLQHDIENYLSPPIPQNSKRHSPQDWIGSGVIVCFIEGKDHHMPLILKLGIESTVSEGGKFCGYVP